MLLADGAYFLWHTIIMKVIFQSKVALEKLRNIENRENQTGTYEL